MGQIRLVDIFKDFPEYVILRKSDIFPDYKQNSDIDILCKDLDECVKYLESIKKFRKIKRPHQHIQLDNMINGKLDVKFDLYGFYISDKFKEKALKTKLYFDGFYVASEMIDNISKCYEYLIYGKQKHSEYKVFKNLLYDIQN